MDLKVGQKIFLKSIGSRELEIIEVAISKIGKKYFEVDKSYLGRYFLEDMLQDGRGYTARYKAYTNMEEIQKEERMRELGNKIYSFFRYGDTKRLTLEQLEQIQSMIDAK